MSAFATETVHRVHHWTETLFSFVTSRQPAFRFDPGQFVMIGLEIDGRPLMRAYSIVSPNYVDHLEFLSIKVPNGPLTSRLQHVAPGDQILIGRKPTGTLVIDNLTPGRNLYLLATGTGLAPFMSIIRDPATYERFERIIIVHGCRHVGELAYRDDLEGRLGNDDLIGEDVRRALRYYPTVTREPFRNTGRIPVLILSGTLTRDLGLPDLSPEHDRLMLCGNPEMLRDVTLIATSRGFTEGNSGTPGTYVIEKAFVQK